VGVALGDLLDIMALKVRAKCKTNLFIARTLSSVGRVCFDLRRAVHSPQPRAFVFCFVVVHVDCEDAHYRAGFFYAWRHFLFRVRICVYVCVVCVVYSVRAVYISSPSLASPSLRRNEVQNQQQWRMVPLPHIYMYLFTAHQLSRLVT